MLWIGFNAGSGLPSKLAGARPSCGWADKDFAAEPERVVGKGGRWLVRFWFVEVGARAELEFVI